MGRSYKTRQMDIILSCLRDCQDELLSAGDIFSFCRDRGTPIGLATVYRCLEALVLENRLKKIPVADGSAIRFQYSDDQERTNAFFLKCDTCGKIIPADCGMLEKMVVHMTSEHGFMINPSRTVLYGRCREC